MLFKEPRAEEADFVTLSFKFVT